MKNVMQVISSQISKFKSLHIKACLENRERLQRICGNVCESDCDESLSDVYAILNGGEVERQKSDDDGIAVLSDSKATKLEEKEFSTRMRAEMKEYLQKTKELQVGLQNIIFIYIFVKIFLYTFVLYIVF